MNDNIFWIVLAVIFAIFVFRSKRRERSAENQSESVGGKFGSERAPQAREFKKAFGFPPEQLSELRCKKELLLRLGLTARALTEAAEDAKRSPRIYRGDYDKLSRDYMETLQLIREFDSAFGAEIPHWTELSEFVNKWQAGESFDIPKARATTVVVIDPK